MLSKQPKKMEDKQQKDTMADKVRKKLPAIANTPFMESHKIPIIFLIIGFMSLSQFLTFFVLVDKRVDKQVESYVFATVAGLILVYLLFPVFGYIGEKYIRYKIIVTGVTVGHLALLSVLICSTVEESKEEQLNKTFDVIVKVILSIGVILAITGTGLFVANMIQFGADQIKFASTREFSKYTKWLILSIAMGILLASLFDLLQQLVDGKNSHYVKYISGGIYFLSLVVCLTLLVWFRKLLNIENVTDPDPVKQIVGVLKFACTHKGPLRPSAFTYGDTKPSRLDLAKTRYGGPFSTQEVEDVKTFWSVVLIVAMSTMFILNYISGLAQEYENIIQEAENQNISTIARAILNSKAVIVGAVTVIGTIIHHLVLAQCFPKLIISMLKRIWIGALLVFIATLITGALKIALGVTNKGNICIEVGSNNTNTTPVYDYNDFDVLPYQLILIPEVLNGFGLLLVYVASLEFIMAQTPNKMQGLVMGFWFLQFPLIIIQIVLGGIRDIECRPEFYGIIIIAHFISFVILTVAIWRYKPRQCNEQADINIRARIEDVFERNFDNRERFLEQEEDLDVNTYSINGYHIMIDRESVTIN